MVLTGVDFPIEAIRQQIGSAIDLIIHLGRLSDKSRKVLDIVEIVGYEGGLMAPFPSVFACLVSRRTRFCSLFICNSAESSIVIMRSSSGIKLDSALRKVVFPEPVPPLTKILYFARTQLL